jgi:class 3 adenylate cyclase
MLSEYFELATQALEGEFGGTLDKFLGDGVLGFFNAPHDLPDHARHGCLAALHLHQNLLAAPRPENLPERPRLRTRIGIHTGEALVGNIGTAERFAYTVLGDTANLASRLEALNKLYGTDILASETTRAAAGPGFEWRRLDRVSVYGRQQATDLHELLGQIGQVPVELLARRDAYELALADYLAGDFASAREAFAQLAAALPADKAAAELQARCAALLENPPAQPWNGVHAVETK